MGTTSNVWFFTRSGALAGAGSVVVFTAVHHLFISDIWYSLLPMMVAGAVCGLCIGWTYALLFDVPTRRGWVRFNLLWLALFAALGVVSVLVFQPITTTAEVIAANEPPRELFLRAAPMTAFFTLAAAALITWRFGRTLAHAGAILLTCAVLVVLLGLNVAVIGLVEVPGSAVYLIVELFVLIIALAAAYAILFLLLERKRLAPGRGDRAEPGV